MAGYWAIAPWPNDEPEFFERVWAYDRANGTIAIRWQEMGDLTGLSRERIEERHRETYGFASPVAARILSDFYNRIALGDVIVARRGRHLCIGIGSVVRTAYFDLAKGNERLKHARVPYIGAHFIDIEWQRVGSIPVSEMFTIPTVSNIGEAKYRRLFDH